MNELLHCPVGGCRETIGLNTKRCNVAISLLGKGRILWCPVYVYDDKDRVPMPMLQNANLPAVTSSSDMKRVMRIQNHLAVPCCPSVKCTLPLYRYDLRGAAIAR